MENMWIAGIVVLVLLLVYIIRHNNKSAELPGVPPPEPVSTFWRPGLYKYEGNFYERAVLRNETIDFLLGNGVYYSPGEWCGDHDSLTAFNSLTDYARAHGSQKMLPFLKRDIALLLKEKIDPRRLSLLVHYIFLYLWDYDKIFTAQWEIEPDIKKMIRQHLDRFIGLYGSEGGPFDCNIPRHEFYTKAAIDNIRRIKEEFGIDLLD